MRISEQFLEHTNCWMKLNWKKNMKSNVEKVIKGYKGHLQDNFFRGKKKSL